MAENVTLARPYAEAVFALARDSQSLAAWAEVLDRLATVVSQPEAQACIGNPQLTSTQVISLLADASGGALSSEQHNFVSVLVSSGRAAFLPEIRELFVQLKNTQEGVKDAVVTSAFPVDQATLAQLSADLEQRFKAKLRVKVEIDPELIGGIRVAVGDEVIDASVRGKLAAMAAALQN